MKKYILSTVAALIIVAISAFTIQSQKPASATYYWYEVDATGQIQSGSEAYSGQKVDMQHANDNLPCPVGSTTDCVRGFSAPLTSFPSSAAGEVSIQKD